MELPKPDAVLYMDVSLETAVRQMRNREAMTNTKGDIHETDNAYLAKCRECGREAAKFYKWDIIQCERNGQIRPIEDIQEEIYQVIADKLQK